MDNLKPLQNEGADDEAEKVETAQDEEKKPMPFGILGIQFLCNATQFAVFAGLTVLTIAIIQICMRR